MLPVLAPLFRGVKKCSVAVSLQGFVGAPLQVKDKKQAALHETAAECLAITTRLLKKAMQKKQKHPIWRDQELYISHDRATFFEGIKDWPGNLGEEYHIMEQPPASPDCHKVVEHPIHSIKTRFRHAFTQLVGRVSQLRAMDLLIECVEEAVDAESIRRDCDTLPATLKSILKNRGDWADGGLR